MKIPTFAACLAFSLLTPHYAIVADDEKPPGETAGGDKKEEAKPDDKKGAEKPKEDRPVETHASVTIGGKAVTYRAKTGTMPILKDDGTPRASVFYVYYAATDATGKPLAEAEGSARPITFCFNGGPGASAVWLHLGGLGPRRLDLPPDGLTQATVAPIVENPNTILDATDLVFVDPVSTGLSRAAKGEKAEQFFGVDEDIQAVGEFVRLFTTRENRWGSPKYLCGESYGVTRVTGLVNYLQNKHGLYPEGLMLISGLVNFGTLATDTGNDLPYIISLPSFTAAAFYHQKLAPDLQKDEDESIAAARTFAQGEYATALLKGSALLPAERRKIAEKVASFTGLTPEQIEDQNLRIEPSYFRKTLLLKEGKVLGRYDGRVTGEEADRSEPRADYDPSYTHIAGGFASAVNAYIRGTLRYESDNPYHILTSLPWKYTSFEGRYVSTEDRLAEALKANSRLRVLVMTGRRDLAVPEDSMRYSLGHLNLSPGAQTRIAFERYESGHMMYLFRTDSEKLRSDLVKFIQPPLILPPHKEEILKEVPPTVTPKPF